MNDKINSPDYNRAVIYISAMKKRTEFSKDSRKKDPRNSQFKQIGKKILQIDDLYLAQYT